MNKLKRKQNERPQAFWGALIGAGTSLVGGLLGNNAAKKQAKLQANINDYNIALQDAQSATNAYNAALDYQQNYLQQFKQQARFGGIKRLGGRNIMITDGGNAKRIGNNTYLLRGGSHEDINETGQTGIGINVGGNEIEAEGGEVAQRKGNSLRIYSAQPILGGISPAEAIMRGYNKDRVFNAQQRFKKNNGIKDDGSKAQNGIKVLAKRVTRNPNGTLRYNSTFTPNNGQAKPMGINSPEFQVLMGLRGLNIPALKSASEPIINYIKGKGFNLSKEYPDLKSGLLEYGRQLQGIVNPFMRYGGLTSKDRGSSKHPYPSVSSKDFAGGNRSYPIPTKADAIDALRLAGLHGRSDVRSKVYNKYPELRKKADFGTWVRTNRNNNVLANLLYESGIIDKDAWRNMLRDIHTFTGMGSNPYNDNQDEAVVTPGFGIHNQAQILRNVQQANKLAQSARASQAVQRISYATKQAKDFYRDLGINIPVGRNNLYNPTFRSSGLAKNIEDSNKALQMSLSNTHLPKGIRLTPLPNKDKAKAIGSAAAITTLVPLISVDLAHKLLGENNKPTSTQKDAKGQPISPYIARPQSKTQTKAKKDYTTQIPDSIRRPEAKKDNVITPVFKKASNKNNTKIDTTRRDTTKQVNKVVKHQVRTTPQYTGNTTRGNYQLHDGETKVINGIKYTRRGNTIINHKTNVGYIYDKNGNYTGQADYSKVGNFNQAFDAARAAGRNQFIYRAGKYNNYSTVKETNAKKEALNRRIGARRIAKRMGGLINPPVERFKCGGHIRPKAEKGMLAPIYSYGTNRRKLPSFAPIDVTPRAIPNFKLVSAPTNTKTPFDPNSVPFLGNQSTFKPATQDYIGLGIDTLAALGSGLINYNSASKTYIPERTSIIQSSKLPTYYNISPQVEEIRRQRNKAFDDISHNTSSSVAAINRMNRIASDSALGIDKLYATKENEENKMLTQDALNQQSVAAENAKLQADYEANKANILNAQNQDKANAINLSLSGLSQAWTNFAGSVESRYDNRQKEAIIAATSKDPAVLSNAVQFGYNFSPEVLAAIYNSTDDDNLKSLALSQLSTKNRLRYGIR